jgi:shikimate dehydrogenase
MKRICVIGWPISHSRSPLIHNYWIKKYNVDGLYEKHAVQPGGLADFVGNFQSHGLSGCNVTVPHKETVVSMLANVDVEARRFGAVNTLYIKDGKLRGTSTDGEGFRAHLLKSHPSFEIKGSNITIIGAGGAAKAIIGILLDQGAREISIINRTADRAKNLQEQFGEKIKHSSGNQVQAALKKCNLFINTTSLGMKGQPPLVVDVQDISSKTIIADIVYAPLETDLLKQAKAQGNPTLGGLGMLLHQAVRGFELWFGIKPEVTNELHDLVVADLMKANS